MEECKQIVTNHQQYEDSYSQCREWLRSVLDRLEVCVEPSTDKQGIQNRLEHLKELATVRQDGDSKIKNVVGLAEEALPQTAPPGQQQIRRDLDALKNDWERFCGNLKETQSTLETAKESWESFDSLYDELGKWLREMEVKVKDYGLKSTLQDKTDQVSKFKVCIRFYCA